ncbi:efflux RND transporter periplasmic adaptor subunit [Pollutimonas thiosulfatoxidans]|uniref:Efflux transporter periplasmic adaptor subunit n=1 Tax=Pollutimonas thiosulfatoxidans TaxID=2028345 RepID=A0A410GAL1_9BURK|nr:efflux RND transporter periplasmic adaptor subunit [Pollutimonas thiosulfatoxidans]MBF6616017.1 efflux RND transporter periplasmic adaptor subunit [Candidimonas sp.]QAA93334.1 efflux transporter periplasmic adaptor subunit [Pollutimonas thiosulfatoxidans]
MSSVHKRYVAVGVAVALLAGAATAFKVYADAEPSSLPSSSPVAAVEVATVAARDMVDWREYAGRLEAVDRVALRPLVSGTLVGVHFADGALVEAGDLLFTIDPRPYEAAVDQAKAALTAAQALVAYTASDVARAKRLLANNATAKRDVDEKRNAARVAAADLQAAQARLESAQLDLEHTRITAPISGRMSRAEVTEGNVVAAGPAAAPLATLVSVARMYASFELDEPTFLASVSQARMGQARVPVLLGLTGEAGYPRSGELASVDNVLDPASGTIRVRAVFDNPDGSLVPGLFARIKLGSSAARPAILIDEKAIGTDQNKRFVVVVDEHNKTAYREVHLGATQEGQRVVEAGLRAGERIVVNGLQRIRPGDPVRPLPALASAGSDATNVAARQASADENS